jgi:hypothetical protein
MPDLVPPDPVVDTGHRGAGREVWVTAASLGELIDDERRRGLVGRRTELRGFAAALAGSPRRILYVHGPGGIGKTTVLLAMRAQARADGRGCVLVDGREIDPSPAGFTAAVEAAGGGADTAGVLMVDGYEQLGPIDGWMRRDFLPVLPADGVVVLAGRDAPAPAWRTDPGWRSLVAVHPLAHLDDAESADLLARAGVPEPTRAALVRLGRGHPLALALLADLARAGTVPPSLAAVPDLVAALLDSLLRDAPSDAHLAGLATCAIAWLTTEDLLRETVGDQAGAVWAWLQRRPFVVHRPRGCTPHDLTREALEAEFERRSPERYRALHRIVHDHVIGGLRDATGVDRQVLAQHLMYLHRRSPLTGAFYALREQGSAAVLPARPDEHGQIAELAGRAFGEAGRAFAAGWLAEGAGRTDVVRAADGTIAGFAHHVICPTGLTLERDDPVVRAALEHAARTAPLRPGERLDVARFMGDATGSQRGLYSVLASSVGAIILWCTEPLAWTYALTTDEAYWGPFFDYLGFRRVFEVEVGGLPHAAYAIDWRRFPPEAWLDLMSEREFSGGTGPPPESALLPPPLDRAAFDAAVRSALRDLNHPTELAANALIGGRLGADPAALRAAVRRAVDGLAGTPKGDQLRAVLHRTFVRPAPTQEAAAEVLGLPFSTYRRHLGRAVDRLAEALWAAETGHAAETGYAAEVDRN